MVLHKVNPKRLTKLIHKRVQPNGSIALLRKSAVQ